MNVRAPSTRVDLQRRRFAVGLVALVTAVVIVVVVTERPGPETSGTSAGLLVAPGSTVVEPWSGREWSAVTGTWHVGRRRLRVVTVDLLNPSIVVTSAGSTDYTVKAVIEQYALSSGLVFRYVDSSNYWDVTAFPQYGIWGVSRVVNGQRTVTGDLGALTCCPGGILLAISTKRSGEMIFSVNGRLSWELTDPALADATATGVLATGADAAKAVVSDFEVIHRVPVISTPTTTGTG
jgi:hypothetical protein